jgi:hypothetical protein
MGIYYPLLEVFNTLSDRLAIADPAQIYLCQIAQQGNSIHNERINLILRLATPYPVIFIWRTFLCAAICLS